MNRIKKNDIAMIMAGDDAGKTGKVLRLVTKKNQIVIEGANLIYKHVRRSQQNPQGGRIQKEAPINLSNVLPYCQKCDRGVKVKMDVNEGRKQRVCRICSTPFAD
ncbi:MAG: 50S ribosomal protein L24 [Planctomycetes bacterium]|nr:50S ribosomal protein L24 [Planctomycetota bacterium]